MKHFLHFLIVIFLGSAIMIGLSVRSYADMSSKKSDLVCNTPDYFELIIQIPDLNEKNAESVETLILNEGGIVFLGYCEKMQVLMFNVDRNMHADNSFINPVLKQVPLDFNIKVDASIAQVQNSCGITVVIPPPISR